GVNEKIEGFYEICKYLGMTGKQGVMIPALNKVDVMLRNDVAADVEAGKFHIYAVNLIDEGIELLTGKKAGKRRKGGGFEKDSIHQIVDQRLRKFHEQIKEAEEPLEDK
ncbi:MAG: ATP-dependent protease, partial [Candidatus Krumholzibacteria bacterium]|nr:ATP-dependent protease [Candidatus Krumholzibacteria bacterium]